MISHRKFFSIAVMMAVILFMFQFSQVLKENVSDHDTNSYAETERISGAERWSPGSRAPNEEFRAGGGGTDRGWILLFDQEEKDTAKIVRQWCTYTKRSLVIRESMDGYSPDPEDLPEYILVDSSVIDYGRDTGKLTACAEQGIHLMFLNLPEPAVIDASKELKELLGIQRVQAERIETEGIHLFDDFLLGGGYIYQPAREEDEDRQDLELEMPWYVTLSGTKTYMVGMLDELLKEERAKNEYFPAVIWRNSYGDTRVFAVNGSYMSEPAGLGILSAMVYETCSYEVYPVVNAQNLLMTDYPGYAQENTEVMEEVYSRPPRAVQRDIVWPTVLSTVRRSGWRLTCLSSAQYDYLDENEPETEDTDFYLQQFKEVNAEAGISFGHSEAITPEEKIKRDAAFYDSTESAYRYSAAYAEPEEIGMLMESPEAYLSELRTIAFAYDPDRPLLYYEDDTLTGQGILGNARSHTYSEDIRLRGVETALGYSSVRMDIHEVLWPESEESHWEKLYEKIASNIDTYWKPYQVFEKTTLTESDRRVRLFLNLDYMDRREGDRIFLDVEGMEDECWFLLRTHGEAIAEITGAEYEEAEDGAYLLHLSEEHAEILLEKSRGVLTYTLPDTE